MSTHEHGTGLKRIVVKHNHTILGYIKDGMVHVEDIIHEGNSEKTMTGSKPDLTPIPLHKFEAMGATVHDA